jgi:hypothetical protein
MTRFYASYIYWEDWKNGLYSNNSNAVEIVRSVALLADQNAFLRNAIMMVNTWEIAAAVQLSNKSRNRQAWIGQATCCFSHGASEQSTKDAWWRLEESTRIKANETADKVILTYERYKGINPCQKNFWELMY